jgi:hypothetical protein
MVLQQTLIEAIRINPAANTYRKKVVSLFDTVLFCEDYVRQCKDSLKPGLFQPGPEISFVGSRYGEDIRILFTRVAPNWNCEAPDLGSRDSLTRIMHFSPILGLDGIYDLVKNYWRDPTTDTIWHGYNLRHGSGT